MASQPLAFPQPPYQSPIADKNGLVTDPWNKWLQQLYLRVGGAVSAPIANINSIPLSNLIAALATITTSILYTSPVGQKTVINSFQIQNIDNTAHTISVWFVPQGLLPNSTNIVVSSFSVPASSVVTISALQYQVINGAGTIQAQASAAGVLNVIANGRLSS